MWVSIRRCTTKAWVWHRDDIYGTNVNARNAFMIQEANRVAALEAARMGEAAARNAANTRLALGGVDFLYKYGMGKGWWE
jgi:uncharacterized protein YfiM (DUF2279 family)